MGSALILRCSSVDWGLLKVPVWCNTTVGSQIIPWHMVVVRNNPRSANCEAIVVKNALLEI